MRQDPDFFGDQELDLLYIGKRLSRSQQVEALLDEAGVDYAVEVDNYVGGTIFRATRAGAFFYVLPADFDRAAGELRSAGLDPQEPYVEASSPEEPG